MEIDISSFIMLRLLERKFHPLQFFEALTWEVLL